MNNIKSMKAIIERRKKSMRKLDYVSDAILKHREQVRESYYRTHRIPDPVPKPFDYEVKTLCALRNNPFDFTPEELWSIYLKHSTLIKTIVDKYVKITT